MIKLEHVVLASPEQMEFIIEGMRNAKNSWDKSDSGFCGGNKHIGCAHCSFAGNKIHNIEMCKMDRKYGFGIKPCGKKDFDGCYCIGHDDHSLMQQLSNAGTDHRKYMRMMPVYARITAPLYWWKEFDTYKVGTVSNSCSTMHKIDEKEFTLDNFSCEHLLNMSNNDAGDALFFNDANNIRVDSDDLLGLTINVLNYYRERFNKTKDKRYWWQMIQLLPSSYNQTRNIMMNYEVLANIYKSRKNHKLNEWREFCKWIESLPYSGLITGSPAKQEQLMLEKQPYHWIYENDEYCNNCEHFHICLDKGGLVDVTTGDDIIKDHYINKPGYDCQKEIKIDNTSWAGLYRHGDED